MTSRLSDVEVSQNRDGPRFLVLRFDDFQYRIALSAGLTRVEVAERLRAAVRFFEQGIVMEDKDESCAV